MSWVGKSGIGHSVMFATKAVGSTLSAIGKGILSGFKNIGKSLATRPIVTLYNIGREALNGNLKPTATFLAPGIGKTDQAVEFVNGDAQTKAKVVTENVLEIEGAFLGEELIRGIEVKTPKVRIPEAKPTEPLKFETKAKPYSKNRPSYGNGQVDQVWENAKQADGNVYDPNTGELLTWDKTKPREGQWNMGHKKGQKYSDKYKDYMDGKITKEEFLKWYQDPSNYKPELPKNNRGHKHE